MPRKQIEEFEVESSEDALYEPESSPEPAPEPALKVVFEPAPGEDWAELRLTAELVSRWLSIAYERKQGVYNKITIEPGSIIDNLYFVLELAFRALKPGGWLVVPEEYLFSEFLSGMPGEDAGENFLAFRK